MSDLLNQFSQTAAAYPNRAAIVNGDGTQISFAQLHSRACDLATAWRHCGIKRGDRVLLALGVNHDLYASLAALWSLGATVVLPEPSMGLAGLKHAVRTAQITAFCATGAYRLIKAITPALWRIPSLPFSIPHTKGTLDRTDLDATALISFTSGTTGTPKAIPRSHTFLMAQQEAVGPLLESDQTERDLVAFPVFVLINLACGRTSILPNWKMSKLAKLSPFALQSWITQQNVTRALLPPALCEKLTETGPLPDLRHVFTGGGPVFPDVVKALQKAHPATAVTCVYGSTEAEPIAHLPATQITNADLDAMENGAGLLVGQPTQHTKIRIVADEIQVTGGHVNKGYLDPTDDAENKVREDDIIWHRTGDAGRINDDGRLWLLGRVGTDVALCGRQTYPFAIEVAVRTWGGVSACAFMDHKGKPQIVISGDSTQLGNWQKRAANMGIGDVQHVTSIPMDKRHGSKVDRKALLQQLGR